MIQNKALPAAAEEKEDDDQEDSSAKYPYIASELFACEVAEMIDTVFDNPDLLQVCACVCLCVLVCAL